MMDPVQITPETTNQTKKPFSHKQLVLIVSGISIALLILSATYYLARKKSTITTTNTATNIGVQEFKLDYNFAEYKLDNTSFKPSLPKYNINYSELINLSSFESKQNTPFTELQKNTLNNEHFFITQNLDKFYDDVPGQATNRNDDWSYLYSQIGGSGRADERKPENSVFISSDFLLHIFHRLLEKEFEYIEHQKFYPRLKEMTDSLLQQAIINYKATTSENDQKSYERILAYFAVPKAIIDASYEEYESGEMSDKNLDTKERVISNLEKLKADLPTTAYELAGKELNLIIEHEKLEQSPIFDELISESGLEFTSDYTQYTPRSHYNKNSVLRSYFRTMMWYGRNNFALKSTELTRDAVNITLLINQTKQVSNWEDIYIPTAFFVGKSDDLGIYEYSQIIKELNLKEINDQTILQIQQKLKDFEGPKIMSSAVFGDKVMELTKKELQEETKGFRFMGQRFTPDAFIFTTLTQGGEKPDPETGESLPSNTTALMVMASLGNKTAKTLTDDWVNTNAMQSKNVLNKKLNILLKQFNDTPQDIWTQNIYWSWLYTIKSLFTDSIDKTGYPMFMQNASWEKKDLQTSLGSWTELKHDTLLYAKQSYAEMGGGPPEMKDLPPVPKGYVEPNILFLDRLIALVKMSETGLASRDLIDGTFQWKNERLIETLRFFRDIAVSEIQNEVISDEDFERLRLEAGFLEAVVSPLPNEFQTENGARSALIADVHTDIPKGQILYEATGIPNYIYAAVKDTNGTRLTKGLVFSYFEFTNPLSQRLTDEGWREINYTNDKSKLPSIPNWSQSLIK